MNKDNVSGNRTERGSQGRFAPNTEDKMSQGRQTNEGGSQGGNGLSQKRDRMEKVSRKGGVKQP
jgi:hypothetical protein